MSSRINALAPPGLPRMTPVAIRRSIVAAAVALAVATGGMATGQPVAGADAATAVLDWNRHAVEALANPATAALPGIGQTPPVGGLHMAMVQAAVYDAVNSIDHRHRPFIGHVRAAPSWASIDAAVVSAAHGVLMGADGLNGVVPSTATTVRNRLDTLRNSSIAAIAPGRARDAGVVAGARAAAAMLLDRSTDGRFATGISMPESQDVGKWRPTLPSFVNDPFAWVSQVRPFTLLSTAQFRTAGPRALGSEAYAIEYAEVKALGSAGASRTTEQQAIASFFQENPIPLWNRTLRSIAEARGLDAVDASRLLAMTTVSGADSIIGCFADKAHHAFWRPITAIRLGDNDTNDETVGDANWLPLVASPPYPEHASGYNCVTAGYLGAAREFFGTDDVSFTVHNNPLNVDRTYAAFSAVSLDTIEARILQGLHFRSADVQGAGLGNATAAWVAAHEFGLRDE